MPKYKYLGNGEFLPGIPARDLSEDEVGEIGEDVLGKRPDLYQKEKGSYKPAPKKSEDEDQEEED